MKTSKKNVNNADLELDDGEFVKWGEKYATGIDLIDDQHKRLVILTNQLYAACLSGDEAAGTAFKEAMRRSVEYVRFHFTAEHNLLEHINYPGWKEHKIKHDTLVKNILETAKDFNEGRKFVPNHFVRTLRDWVFGHIAVEDKNYSSYVHEQIMHNHITPQQIRSYIKYEDKLWKQRLHNFTKSLAALKNAIDLAQKRELSELEKQGMIQEFTLAFELAWNMMKDYLEEQGVTGITDSKSAVRETFMRGLIAKDELQIWKDMMWDRNLASHIYDENTAGEIIQAIRGVYCTLLVKFAEKMKRLE